jgi:hypothetical protein
MLRTSVVPTMLKAGVGPNVIPSEAEATIDIRALPDENIPRFYEAMRRVIDDPAIAIVPLPVTRPPSPASRLDTEMYRVLEQVSRRMYPGSTVLPSMSTGASDQAHYAPRASELWDRRPYRRGPPTSARTATSSGAREASLYAFVEFTWNAVTEVAVKVGSRAVHFGGIAPLISRMERPVRPVNVPGGDFPRLQESGQRRGPVRRQRRQTPRAASSATVAKAQPFTGFGATALTSVAMSVAGSPGETGSGSRLRVGGEPTDHRPRSGGRAKPSIRPSGRRQAD